MDHRGPKLLALICLGSAFGSAALASGGSSLIRAMDWLAPENYRIALSSEPATRLKIASANKDAIDKLIIGKTLFNTPGILGGQAAKAGISCASCHSNGRGNPYFQFPGVSGAPGTADVTHSFFSSFRGNSTFDPVVIPDLVKPGKISRDPASGALEKFVRDLIVEEFNGAEPSSVSLNAIAHYLRSITAPPGEGGTETRQELDLVAHLDHVEEAFYGAEQALQKKDSQLAVLLLAGARHQTGLIHERYQGAKLNKEARKLEMLSQQLGEIQNAVRGRNANMNPLLQKWADDFSRARDMLAETTERSLYNPQVLAAALRKEGFKNAHAD